MGANLENLVLTGTSNRNDYGNELDNTITGNSGNNGLRGYDGNDVLDGGTGADTMAGGLGNDSYYVDDSGDVVTELAGQGTDTVLTSLISYSLGSDVENLTLMGSGNSNGTGNGLDNVLTGTMGDNILDGGVGADTLIGGLGNDSYIVDNIGDVIVEATSAGVDNVQASVTYALATFIENLALTGGASINGTGNVLDNVITGNSGDNSLDGGAGADTLTGGLGNRHPILSTMPATSLLRRRPPERIPCSHRLPMY